MSRTKRAARGGYVYHVLNRVVGRMRRFDRPRDYEAFEEILVESVASGARFPGPTGLAVGLAGAWASRLGSICESSGEGSGVQGVTLLFLSVILISRKWPTWNGTWI